ncbi:MAG: hypothetical protein FWC50_11475, partial [Planctomycetaceae bacterium]|nr:hypothetical protein [Planctomycetaceae bacterium]
MSGISPAQENSDNRGRRGGMGGMRPGGFPGGGGGFPGGGFPGGASGGGMGDRLIEILKTYDANNDGRVTLDEIPEARRGFAEMMMRRAGMDPSKPIVLSELQRSLGRTQNNNSVFGVGSKLTNPLVPEFGESVTYPKVLNFGERVETKATAQNVSAESANADRIQRQTDDTAQQIMNRYDRDKNGSIDKAAGEWDNLKIDTNKADINRDGRITMDELKIVIGNELRGGSGGARRFTVYSTTYEHLPEGVPAWFTERDKDNDGQLTLLEFANGQPLTGAIIDEFENFLDLNNDGLVTVAECYTAIKAKDELERKQKEQQAKAQQGRGGTQNDRRQNGNQP